MFMVLIIRFMITYSLKTEEIYHLEGKAFSATLILFLDKISTAFSKSIISSFAVTFKLSKLRYTYSSRFESITWTQKKLSQIRQSKNERLLENR